MVQAREEQGLELETEDLEEYESQAEEQVTIASERATESGSNMADVLRQLAACKRLERARWIYPCVSIRNCIQPRWKGLLSLLLLCPLTPMIRGQIISAKLCDTGGRPTITNLTLVSCGGLKQGTGREVFCCVINRFQAPPQIPNHQTCTPPTILSTVPRQHIPLPHSPAVV